MPSLGTLRDGRKGLPGPLAQLGLGRDGTFYVVAAGRCNHAGVGDWNGVSEGNLHFIGIEAENRGSKSDPWPAVQLEAYRQGVAAILNHLGRGVDWCVGHKEWARARVENKRSDPSFDMVAFRSEVAKLLNAGVPKLAGIPAAEPAAQAAGRIPRPTLQRGMESPLCEQVQTLLGVVPTSSHFGPLTEKAVREFQRAHGLVPDGVIGPRTWLALDVFRDERKAAAPGEPIAIQPFVAPATGGMAWGKKMSPEFKEKVRHIAADIGCEANDLMACMQFESGLDPKSVNSSSGATGLIQFTHDTAKSLGTTTEALKAMTAEAQLDYVAKYFHWWGKVKTLEDTYMAIFCPAGIGKPPTHVLYARPSKQYDQNAGLDADKDGRITKAEASARVRKALMEGLKAENLG
jgi:peptidoglycan hydrolase-like protein with peptidoglycan-binding domain